MSGTDSSFRTLNNLELSNYSAGILIADILYKHYPVRLKAKGDSMFPLILNNDLITVSPWKCRIPEVGDIVVCFDNSRQRFVIHRVVRIKKKNYEIKGDFCFHTDGYFAFDNLIGYVSTINHHHDILPFPIQLKLKKIISFLSRTNLLTLIAKIVKKYLTK